jgi:hypothetical protein
VKTPCAVLALVVAAATLPGCYAARKMFLFDISDTGFVTDWGSGVFRDQCQRTVDGISGLPGKLGDHFDYCWRSATSRDPVTR